MSSDIARPPVSSGYGTARARRGRARRSWFDRGSGGSRPRALRRCATAAAPPAAAAARIPCEVDDVLLLLARELREPLEVLLRRAVVPLGDEHADLAWPARLARRVRRQRHADEPSGDRGAVAGEVELFLGVFGQLVAGDGPLVDRQPFLPQR